VRTLGWCFALLIVAGAGLTSCSAGKLLVVNTLARGGDYQLQADLAYGADPRQRLDLYLPPPTLPAKPFTLVFIPGGCWGACETFPKEDYRFVADTFVAQGYPVAIVNYRLFPDYRFDTIIADVAAAVEFLAEGRPGVAAPAESLVLLGHSAGGHMASLLALDERHLQVATRARLRGWIGFAGPYDFLPYTEDYQPALFAPEERYPDSQPVNFVSRDDAPALLLYGNDDTSVKPRNILSLSRRLAEQGVAFQARCYDDIDHAGIIGALSRPLRSSQPVLADVLAFLRQLEQGRVLADQTPLQCPAAPASA
jgi:acetyl esterase/lipase